MTLNTNVGLTIRATNTSTIGLATVSDPMSIALALVLASGTGSGKADESFHDERTLGLGGSETLDFSAGGGLTDSFGNAIAMVRLKVLMLVNASADASLQLGNAPTSALDLFVDNSSVFVMPSGSTIFLFTGGAAGLDITAQGALKIKHGGEGAAGVNYKIVAIGASA